MSHSIQLYSGIGASNLCVQAWKRELKDSADCRFYKIDEFNSFHCAGFNRGNVALVIVPGGNACAMLEPMLQLAEKINQAVAGESSFLGSCAGAIISSPYGFEQDFKFNPVPNVSKYYMPNSDSTVDPENKSVLEIDWLPSNGHFQTDRCRLYHAFGPSFPLEKISEDILYNCRVLAKYKTDGNVRKAHNSAAAVLYRPSGSTSRLVAGVHPEIGVAEIQSREFAQSFDKADHPHIKVLAENMLDSEVTRKEMCRSWFSELGLKVKNIG